MYRETCAEYLAMLTDVITGTHWKSIIVGGDFNSELLGLGHIEKMLRSFCEDTHLFLTDHLLDSNDRISFQNTSGGSSLVDHFLVSENIMANIGSLKTLDSGANLSDHLPLALGYHLPLNVSQANDNGPKAHAPSPHQLSYTWKWDKADKLLYYNLTYAYLSHIDCSISSDEASIACRIESLNNEITKALCAAALAAVPRKPRNFLKFWWSAELQQAKMDSINAHNAWIDVGKPHQGVQWSMMLKCKRNYKSLLKMKTAESSKSFSDNLAESLMSKNKSGFWKCWNSKFSKASTGKVIEGLCDEKSIANKFADYFSSIASNNSKC